MESDAYKGKRKEEREEAARRKAWIMIMKQMVIMKQVTNQWKNSWITSKVGVSRTHRQRFLKEPLIGDTLGPVKLIG